MYAGDIRPLVIKRGWLPVLRAIEKAL